MNYSSQIRFYFCIFDTKHIYCYTFEKVDQK